MKTDPPNGNSPPGNRIEAIRSSIRCFVLSLVGLVPLLGIPFLIAAMIEAHKAKIAAGTDWNPAGKYLRATRFVAPLGLLISAGFLVLVFFAIPAFWRDMSSCGSGST